MKPKVIASMIFFYGEEYLEASIKSIEPFCDKIVILWTNHPTQGYGTDMKSPDSDKNIKAIAEAASSKVMFVDVSNETIQHEGDHRNQIYKYITDEDILLMVDPDEIFEPKDLEKALELCSTSPYREHGVRGYYHFWRSFNHCCTDGFLPIRFINLKVPFVSSGPKGIIDCRIYHFSLCQREETIRFKMKTFGHASELRPDYIDSIWKAWTPDNGIELLHPTSLGIWHKAQEFDKAQLPPVLFWHPNFNKTFKNNW